MAKRRLTKTAVQEAIHETKTKPFADQVSLTLKRMDGRHEVSVRLFDRLDDPRSTPAGEALIGHLEASGWAVTHRLGRAYSTLTVSEPVSAPEEG
ncbi:hypothetical protein AB0F17_08530 [Nonomuraea sp. NPDC026600]|uniref:hypothetical protein n=1 Tax=Nonomuraea sp. NPDC026600 TaxID=3155363 RepID=UPI003401D639